MIFFALLLHATGRHLNLKTASARQIVPSQADFNFLAVQAFICFGQSLNHLFLNSVLLRCPGGGALFPPMVVPCADRKMGSGKASLHPISFCRKDHQTGE